VGRGKGRRRKTDVISLASLAITEGEEKLTVRSDRCWFRCWYPSRRRKEGQSRRKSPDREMARRLLVLPLKRRLWKMRS
jgi:hypothetical protein